MIKDNERDELIFDFLEGNLNPEEEEAFLILKEESELFNRQVRLWQNTYVQEPLPSVDSLEEKLFIHSNGHTKNSFSRIYVLLAIMFIFPTIMGDRGSESVPDIFSKRSGANNPVRHELLQNLKGVFNCVEQIKTTDRKLKKSRTITRERAAIYASVVLPDLKTPPLFEPQDLTLQKIRITKIFETRKPASVLTRKQWTKRERRQIRKKLRDDNENRKANEFLKGNVLYTVPLNSNNF